MKIKRIDNPIFMIGMPRSGTTIISEAISMHEDLGWFSNYLNYFPNFCFITLLNRITDTPCIGTYIRGHKKQGNTVGLFIKRLLPHCVEAYPVWSYYCGEKFCRDYLINQTASEDEKRKVTKLVNIVLMLQGKRRFFTKLTGPSKIHYLNSIFQNPYYIHIIRDPRAVISSLLKVSFWREKGGLEKPWWQNGFPDTYIQEWLDNDKSPVALAALQWKWVVELTWQEKALVENERYIEIRYEDFVTNPHESLRRIFKQVNLEDSRVAHKYLDSVGKVTDMNFKYKDSLSKVDITMIEKLTFDVAKKAGYDFKT